MVERLPRARSGGLGLDRHQILRWPLDDGFPDAREGGRHSLRAARRELQAAAHLEVAAHGSGVPGVHAGERPATGTPDGRPGARCPRECRHGLLGRRGARLCREGRDRARLPRAHRLRETDEAVATPARIIAMPTKWYHPGYSRRKIADKTMPIAGMRCMVAPAREGPSRCTT